jgi:hypothetical protein
VLQKLPNRPITPFKNGPLQLIINRNSPLSLLVNADNSYVTKALKAIKNTMLGSPITHAIHTIKFLNANNAILTKSNAQLVATARARQKTKKGKKNISKARLLSQDDANKLRATEEAKEAADEAHKLVIAQKKERSELKKAQEKAEKTNKATQRAQAKDTRETNVEMGRMARIDPRLFT